MCSVGLHALEKFINDLKAYVSTVNDGHTNIEKVVDWKSGLRHILAVGVDSEEKKKIKYALKSAKNALEGNTKRCKDDQDVINEAIIELSDKEDGADFRLIPGRKCTSDQDSGIGASVDSGALFKVELSLGQLVDDALARNEGDDARSMSDRNLPYSIQETGNSVTVGNPQTREECNDPAELPPTNQESACGCAAGGEIAQLGRVADTRKSDPTEHDEMIRSLTSYPCSSCPAVTQMPRRNTERPKRDSEAFASSIGPADQQFMAAQGNTRKASPNMNILAPEAAGSGATMPDREPSTDESTEASPNMNILTIDPDDLGATMPGPGPLTDVSTEDSLQKTQHVTDV